MAIPRALRQDARDIVELFFELFEYSEEEKEVILNQRGKERKLWGLF
jgi:hypothetical protein